MHRNRVAEWARSSSAGHWLIGGHPLQLVRQAEGWTIRPCYTPGAAYPPAQGSLMVPGWDINPDLQLRWHRQAREWLLHSGLEHAHFPTRRSATQELQRTLQALPPPWDTEDAELRKAPRAATKPG